CAESSRCRQQSRNEAGATAPVVQGFRMEANKKGASLMSVRMRIVAGAAALAALVLSVSTASACCGGCRCGHGFATSYAPAPVYRPVTVYAPVQPTYAVDQGPVYQVPAAVAPEPVPEYVGPSYGYGYSGLGYRGLGYRGWGYRGYRGGLVHRAAYRGWRGGYRGYHRGHRW